MSLITLLLVMSGLANIIMVILLILANRDIELFRERLALPLTTADAAAILRVSPTTVRRMARKGLIESRRVGKQYRFSSEHIRELDLRNLPAVANPAPYPFTGGIPQLGEPGRLTPEGFELNKDEEGSKKVEEIPDTRPTGTP